MAISQARAMIDRTEQVRQKHFVKYFASLQIPDVAFWDYTVEYFATQVGTTMQVRNYLDLIARELPRSHAMCCTCHAQSAVHSRGGAEAVRPCYLIEDLWSACFRRYASDKDIATFLLEKLGIFGIFGNVISRIPVALLRADPRLSWVVNNAQNWASNHERSWMKL